MSERKKKKQLYEKYKNSPEYEDKRRLYYARNHKNPKIIPCRICGEPVPPTFRENRMGRPHYHEDCVLSEAMEAVRAGCRISDKRILRARNTYGYTLSEIIEEMKEKENVNEV